MLSPGERVAVAVSGGADSVALLAALRELAPSFGVRLSVAHVNHQLRGEESDGDQAFVAELARAFGLEFHCAAGPVVAGENVEQGARNARLSFFCGLVATGQLDKVATAHTEDDQAETVLFRLLRGTGPAGLAGILPVTAEGLIRPALDIPRRVLRQWAVGQGLAWREDRSNADPAFARNRLRATLLPMLERDWNPAIGPCLAQLAQLARQDDEFLEAEAARQAGGLLRSAADEAWVLEIGGLMALPAALRGRVIRESIRRVRGGLGRIGFEHVARILLLAESGEGDGRLQIPGVDILRSFSWLRFAPWPSRQPETRNWTLSIMFNREMDLPGQMGRLMVQAEPRPGAYNEFTDWLDQAALTTGDLEIRNWRPGDFFSAEAGITAERVKLLFQQYRIPLWERRYWPMITKKDEIVWMLGMGAAAGREAQADCPALAVRTIEPAASAVNMRDLLNRKRSSGRLLS